ncbi:hypothetical protein [Glycomyces sp. YM15]|uniref:hypothetical protein n=1 Tax=Glycomyces sp. YM15 TaxID=2800446 RepID=UPI001964FE89|nr:hypothetical protein [Glycomyces sp. YM15]
MPARAKSALQPHRPYRTWLGFDRLRRIRWGEAWGRHGCSSRESAAGLFASTASRARKTAALDSGDLTADDLNRRRRTPARHRRRPSPRHQSPADPLADMDIELAAVR